MEHILANIVSLRRNNGRFVFSNGEFIGTYPRAEKEGIDAGVSLKTFRNDMSVLVNLKTALAGSFARKKTHFHDFMHKNSIKLTQV